MSDLVLVIDFPSIKRFVFGTDPAREIRGASALLEELNIGLVPSFLEQRLPGELTIPFMGGGAGLVIVIGATIADIDACMAELDHEVSRRSGGGLRVAWGRAEGRLSEARGFRNAVRRAHLDLAARRGLRSEATPRLRTGLLRECSSCSAPGAELRWARDPESEEWLCRSCLEKRRHRHAGRSWRELVEHVGLEGAPERFRPDDFTVIANLANRKGYAGLLYLDGDSMGRVVKQIPSPEQYQLFSKTVDGSLRQATFEALADEPRGDDQVIPADILLLGGDDLVMVTPADRALPLALRITARFRELTQKRFTDSGFFDEQVKTRGLTVSAGIALFKQRQPFRTVLDQAEALLDSAKKRRAAEKSDRGWIDLADVSQTRFVDVEDLRRQELELSTGQELTLWPLPVDRARRFHDSLVELDEARVPKGRVAQLARALQRGSSVTFETMRVIARARERERLQLQKFFVDNEMWPQVPWREVGDQRQSGVLDLDTLYPHYYHRGGSR